MAERDEFDDQAERLKTIVEKLRAGLWDRHYGKWLSAEYARSVDEQFDLLLKEIPDVASALRESGKREADWKETVKNLSEANLEKLGEIETLRRERERFAEAERALQWCIDNGGWRLFYYSDDVPSCFDLTDFTNPKLRTIRAEIEKVKK